MPPKRKKTDEQLSKPVGQSLLSPFEIRKMRERMGLYLRELAVLLNVSTRMVQLWEAGSKSISHAHAIKIQAMHKRTLEEGARVFRRKESGMKHLMGITPF